RFCNEWVPQNLNHHIVDRLREHQQKRHRVILLSASPSIYVQAVARCLQIDEVVCTKVQLCGDVCTGRIEDANCKGVAKLQALQHYLGMTQSPTGSHSYGDSSHD